MVAGGAVVQEKYFREAVLFNSGDTWKIFHVLAYYVQKVENTL
jgi:hypothetical protein